MKGNMLPTKEIIELNTDLTDGQTDHYSASAEQGPTYVCNSLEITYE